MRRSNLTVLLFRVAVATGAGARTQHAWQAHALAEALSAERASTPASLLSRISRPAGTQTEPIGPVPEIISLIRTREEIRRPPQARPLACHPTRKIHVGTATLLPDASSGLDDPVEAVGGRWVSQALRLGQRW